MSRISSRSLSQRMEEDNNLYNGQMFSNVLNALLSIVESIEHIHLQIGGKHYLGSHIMSVNPHEAPFHEDLPRLPGPNFYYTLEDTLFEKLGEKNMNISWSIHRPTVIFGFSPYSLMNLLGSLAVYAALCKKEGMEFRYPGNWVTWEGFMDASDADLVAEQQIWAAIESNGKNQAFNVTNGDVFRWKQLWRVIAEKMGVEVGSYDGQGFSMAEEMKDKGNLWDTIVKENGLVETKIEQVGQWWFVDRILNRSFENVGSMNKSKKFGFFGFRNTENCCLQWIDRLRDHKIIP